MIRLRKLEIVSAHRRKTGDENWGQTGRSEEPDQTRPSLPPVKSPTSPVTPSAAA